MGRLDDVHRQRARELRRNLTWAELLVWCELRKRRIGHRIRRQHPIGPYVADFACVARRLIIEIDGDSHTESTARHDHDRHAALRSRGYRILRFSDIDVVRDLDSVIRTIMYVLDDDTVDPDDW